MRHVKTTLLFCLLPLLLQANFVNWMGDYDTAHSKALKEKKPLLVLVARQDTPLSSKIIHTVFMNKPYVDRINNEMIPVIVMYEGTVNYPIEMYYTTVFPTLFFVDSSREVGLTSPIYGKEITVKAIKKKIMEIFN